MKRTLILICIGAVLPFVAGFLFLKLGGMPVATKGEPLPFERFLTRTALRAAMKGETAIEAPIPADEPNLRAGAKIYGVHCAVCHGFPNKPPTAIASGMFPRPPLLLPPEQGVTDDPVGKIFWKVKNGIRLTGMPGFERGLSVEEMWQVSLFLLHVDQLPAGTLDSI